MIHIKALTCHKTSTGYPYDLPFFNQTIRFTKPVTFIIGDNGSGKSTLLELIKNNLGLFQIGKPILDLPKVDMSLSYQLKKPKGLYFSSKDFTTYIHELEKEKASAKAYIREVEETYQKRSLLAQSLAKMPHASTLHDIDLLHDRNLNESSHGQAYLSFFKSRIRDNQLLLLDEPETPLSFQNQLALMLLIKEAEQKGNQVIIATNSPILIHYPGAEILLLDGQGIKQITLDEVDYLNDIKSFIQQPERFLKHLFE